MIVAEALSSSEYTSLSEDPDWQWKLDASENDVTGLWNVPIWVKYERKDGNVVESHLCQMVIDPSIRGSTFDHPASSSSSSSSSADSSSSANTSNSSSS